MEQRYFTVREVAQSLGYSERSVREKLASGGIRGTRIDGKGKWLIPCEELERLLGRGPKVKPGGPEESLTLMELTWHVLNHGTYHRGHLMGLAEREGWDPPGTDFLDFVLER